MVQRELQPNLNAGVPPQNMEAEMATLGAMLISPRAPDEVFSILNKEDFYRPAHALIYEAMRQLAMENRAIDLVTLKDELVARRQLDQVGGVAYLIQLTEACPAAANAAYYAGIVLDKATLRRLEQASRSIISSVHEPNADVEQKIDEAEAAIFEVGQRRLGTYFEPVRKLAKDFFKDVEHLYETGEPILGLPSGFSDLDSLTTGMYEGDLVIVAARPAMGKTSLVLNMALHVARLRRGNVAVFSLEMTGSQLVRRMISTLARVPMNALKRANLSNDDFEKLTDACELLYDLPLHIDDAGDLTPMQMRGKCRRLKADGGLALVVVDYLQLMQGNRRNENRTQEIGEIARSLKSMAKELGVPVIALSQLNRGPESREDKRPLLSDIRESGSIEAEADCVMLIYREAYYQRKEQSQAMSLPPDQADVAELIIAKHRNGPTGTVLLGFQPSYTRFTLLDDVSKQEYLRRKSSAGDE